MMSTYANAEPRIFLFRYAAVRIFWPISQLLSDWSGLPWLLQDQRKQSKEIPPY